MDAGRALQLLTDLAYLGPGNSPVAAALRSHERARLAVAILFGALAATVGLQEIRLLSCTTSVGCVTIPASTELSTILILVVPYALLRLVDDIDDVPAWQMWFSLALLIALAPIFAFSGPTPPPWLILLLTLYLVI